MSIEWKQHPYFWEKRWMFGSSDGKHGMALNNGICLWKNCVDDILDQTEEISL